MAKPETVVDYDAWNRGYSPPSEHVLIDQLAYRGARVVLGCDLGTGGAFWVVMRGKRPNAAVRKAMREMMELVFEDEPETPAAESSPLSTEES